MLSVVKLLVILALLAVPILVITAAPRLFELAGSVPSLEAQVSGATPTPAFRLADPTPTVRSRFAPSQDTPPPTLSPPATTPRPAGTPRPATNGERVVIGNTGGIGAVLRADPVTGRAVAALHEQQVVDVVERRNVSGSGDWVHVRTAEGVDGWVTAVVALPVATPANR